MNSASVLIYRSTIVLLFVFAPLLGHTSSCCGGGTALPSIITGFHKLQTTVTGSYGDIIGDAESVEGIDAESTNGYFLRPEGNSETSKTVAVSAAYQLNDYWQLNAATSVVQRDRTIGDLTNSSTGLGDVKLGAAWEFLPELTYTKFKPRGFLYANVQLPTAPSVYDAKGDLKSDARGEGQYSLAIGTAFLKIIGSFDYLASATYRYRLPREFNNGDDVASGIAGQTIDVGASSVLEASIGAGYSFSFPLRLGLTAGPRYTSSYSVAVAGSEGETDYRLVWDAAFTTSYLFGEDFMLAVTYLDQTVLGPARNTTLERRGSLILQRRLSL